MNYNILLRESTYINFLSKYAYLYLIKIGYNKNLH